MKTTEIIANLKQAEFDAGIVFSGKPTNTKVNGYVKPCPFTPKVNPNYIFHEASRDIIVWLIAQPSPLYVCGVMGAGKSSCISQLAARLNYPVFEVTGHNRLEFQDLVGHNIVENGNMLFEYGPLALAMKYGGLFLLNELDLLEPSTATGLNGTLDGQPSCVPENGGELIEPHPMFRFAATANANGGSVEYSQKEPSQSFPSNSCAKIITHALAPLIKEAGGNPDVLSFEPRIALEWPTPSGGKTWTGIAKADRLILSWGKCGTSGVMKEILKDQCARNNPVLELQVRSLGKLAKGYDIVPNKTRLP